MTFKEAEEKFLSGEVLAKRFYSRKTIHDINGENITQKQFERLVSENEITFKADYGMVTKHFYTFKQIKL